jgi:hypothetical protein
MRRSPQRGQDRQVLLALAAAILLLSPAVRVWAAPESPWWLLFALWAALIAMIGWASARARESDDEIR